MLTTIMKLSKINKQTNIMFILICDGKWEFQKHVVRTKFDIYVFITIDGSISLMVDY